MDSPSKNTRSQARSTGTSTQSLPIIQSPPRKRKAVKDSDDDLAVWEKTDEQIIEEAKRKWTSPVYNHYIVSLRRNYQPDGTTPRSLTFVFTCRFENDGIERTYRHTAQTRPRMKTGNGTSNLAKAAKACDEQRGQCSGDDTSVGTQQTLHQSVSTYTPARHRAIVALRCAVNHRPFEMVRDKLYVEEVKLLRPGTKLVSPGTVSTDVKRIYNGCSIMVRDYFRLQVVGAIHLAVDGWTAPIASSYLGIVVIWYANGRIYRAILEFIRFGLAQRLHTICMDNATNCDTTASELGKLIPTFRGQLARTRCFPHILNLIAKLFDDLTHLFSEKEVPLVHQVVPMMEELEHSLERVRDAEYMPKVIRIAAIASLLVLGKYYALTDDTDVYRIAIVMCPDKKLAWFEKSEDWREEDRKEVGEIVRRRWKESYEQSVSASSAARPERGPVAKRRRVQSEFSSGRLNDSSDEEDGGDKDELEAYLSAPPVSKKEIKGAGGVLKWWESMRTTRPRLAQMALDFLTAPASAVDAERAFSAGRLQVNHLQHAMSSQTFKAKVALGSWYGTPLLPDIKEPTRILAEAMSRQKDKGKEKDLLEDDDIVEIV
ncbi:hypothetical protein VNI00_006271 [Paramarasmius palmivorus]|uniref:HAT C-terminal dimerisation domain-containing protein n=1 Tax=Paramarasmius palmivorus TaxID=297713 RepID=A0AAW0D9B8_9AGAR